MMISSLLSKAFLSALVGSPIAYSLNVGILPSLSELIDENVFLASFLITLSVVPISHEINTKAVSMICLQNYTHIRIFSI